VFLSTSEYEGYGMSVIEAGLAGVPVVTTDVGIAGEILVDGKNSYIVSVGDIMGVAARISDLIVHNEKRSLLRDALRDDIAALIPSAETYVDAYVAGITETLKNHI
jgi:glycosyltransferase involved in cell wall biosynthesis